MSEVNEVYQEQAQEALPVTAEGLKELEVQSLNLLEQVVLCPVVDQPSYDRVALMGSTLKALGLKIQEYYKPLKEAADHAKQVILDEEKKYLAPVKEALETVKSGMNKYLNDQEALRKQEEERLRKEREDAAEKERQKLLKQAQAAEQKGNTEKAEEKRELAEAVYVAPVVLAPAVKTNTANSSAQGELKVVVVDLDAFVKELVKRGMAPTMLEAKIGPLKAWVKANDLKAFPGLSIEKTLAVRLKR